MYFFLYFEGNDSLHEMQEFLQTLCVVQIRKFFRHKIVINFLPDN